MSNGLRHASFLLTLSILIAACSNGGVESDPTAVLIVPASTAVPLEPAPTTAVSPTATAGSKTSVDSAISASDAVPLDTFYEDVLLDLLERDPEFATSASLPGLDAGAYNGRLSNESPAYEAETVALLRRHLDTLRAYAPAEQSAAQQISTAVLDWYLDDVIRREPYAFYEYRMSPLFGLPWQFPNLMTTEHPLNNQADAVAYVSRLNQFNEKAAQVIAGLELAEEQGVLPPRWMFGWALGELQDIAGATPRRTDFYQHLEAALSEMESLSDADKEALLADAETAIADSVIPGYQALVATLQDQMQRAGDEAGAWKHPQGDAYYQAELRHHTTTDLTPDEVHEIGLAEVARIQNEIRLVLADLGYDSSRPLADVLNEAGRDAGSFSGTAPNVVAEYEALIGEAETAVAPYFDILPETPLKVDTISGGTAYYLTPALDGSRPGIFYAPAGGGTQSRLRLATTAYHEAIPGHHFQIALQAELEDVPSFRKVLLFTAYTEGWALYAEQLAAEIGLYENDPYGDLGRLQMELFRAARLVVDTGIHARGWSQPEAVNYMVVNTGLPQQWVQFEVSRYIVWPGQAASYKIGHLKILELRDLAQQELGDDFELRAFHNVVLQNGAMPLDVLEQVVLNYIDENR